MSLNNVYNADGEKLSNMLYDTKVEGFRRIEYVEKNCIINQYDGGQWEIVYYIKPFKIPKHVALDESMINDEQTYQEFSSVLNLRRDNIGVLPEQDLLIGENTLGQRNFTRIGDIAFPLREGVRISDLERTIVRGGKRAKDNFYNYALSNSWEFFGTYTFAAKSVRVDLNLISKTWYSFVRMLRAHNPNVRVIAVPEPFENEEPENVDDGDYYFPDMQGFHLHALLGGCDLALKPKRYMPGEHRRGCVKYRKGDFMYTPFGAARMQCVEWKNGFNEVCMINPDSAQLQVVNYLTKYLTKGFNLPFGCHRFYRTRNLSCRFNDICLMDMETLNRCVSSLGMHEYKRPGKKPDEERVLVYRSF